MVFRCSFILPVILLFWIPITCLITYLIGYYGNDIQPLFPFVSDTGTWSPESCVFGLMMNLGAIQFGLIVYIRYRQLREVFKNQDNIKASIKNLNRFSFYIALIGVLGLIIVANFQETNVFSIHILGAAVAFVGGSVYQLLQTYLSFYIYPKIGNRKVNIFRIFCTIISNIALGSVGVLLILALIHYKGKIEDMPKWSEADGGFIYRTSSAASEWILVSTTVLFLASFTGEFRHITLSEPPIKLNDP